jgi:hypothetical protein
LTALQFLQLRIEPPASISTFSKLPTLEELANKVHGCIRLLEGQFPGFIRSREIKVDIQEDKARQEDMIMVSSQVLYLHLQAHHVTTNSMIAGRSTMGRDMEIRVLHLIFQVEAEAVAEAAAELHHHRALKAHLAIRTMANVGCLLRRLRQVPVVLPLFASGFGAWLLGAG